jgi:hypothetical protein
MELDTTKAMRGLQFLAIFPNSLRQVPFGLAATLNLNPPLKVGRPWQPFLVQILPTFLSALKNILKISPVLSTCFSRIASAKQSSARPDLE